jgi:hypothetical protein
MEITMTDRRATAGIFAAYFVVFMTAFFVLGGLFEFPDILREEASYRFSLFQSTQGGIVIAYYAMVVSSVLQVFMAVSLFTVLSGSRTLNLLGLASGIAAGVFQVLGYARWVTVIPVLSDTLNAGSLPADTVFALERMLNSYLGMGIGEHLGTLFLALWLPFAAIAAKGTSFIPRGVRTLMLASGWALTLVAMEALGGVFAPIGVFTVALWGVFYAFILVFVTALVKPLRGQETASVHWGVWLFAGVFWLGNVIPSFIG